MRVLLRKLNMILAILIVLSFLTANVFAESVDLDRSSYVDGSQYNNAPVEINHVKVGLLYDDKATDRVYLDVTDGAGFELLTYDKNRNPVKLSDVVTNHVVIVKDNIYSDSDISITCYHIRLNESYDNYDAACAVAEQYDNSFVGFFHGRYYVMVGFFNSIYEANEYANSNEIPGHGSTTGKYGVKVLDTSTKTVLFAFDMHSAFNLSVAPIQYENKPTTNFNGKVYYGSFEVLRSNGMNLSVINCVPLEDYVKGVIPYEMSPSWPLEALKAQALCARTYVAKHINEYADHGFDVRDDTYSQVYGGVTGATESSDAAVDETAGMYVRYQGELCNTYYFSCDGGATESSAVVFGQEHDYLIGKEDPFESAISFPNKTWNKTITASQLTSLLNSKGYQIGNITDIQEEYTGSGNCSSITFFDSNKNNVTLDHTAYNILGLPSCHFTAEKTKIKVVKKVKKETKPTPTPTPTPTPSAVEGAEPTPTPTPTPKPTPTPPQYEYITEYYDGFAFNGGGWGHNCGMSQWGAYSMAYVYGYSCDDIIRFYFTGAYIA